MQVISSTDTTEDTLAKLRLDQTAAGFDEPIKFDDLQKLENGGVCIRARHRCLGTSAFLMTVTPNEYHDIPYQSRWDVQSWHIGQSFSTRGESGEELWSMPKLSSTFHGGAHRCDSLESAVHFAKGVAESELRQKRSWFAEDWFKARLQSEEAAEAARGSFHVVA